MVVEQLFQNSNSDPEMFDPSLCPICGVQYGGNLHNVPPQQGGLDSSYKRQKHNFAFLEFTSHHPSSLLGRDTQRKISPLIKLWGSFPKIGKLHFVFSRQVHHLLKKFYPHCPEILSWSNIEFQQSPLFTAVGAEGGGGGGGGGTGAQEIKGFWCIQHQHFSQTGLNSASCRSSKRIKHLIKTQWLHSKMWLLQWFLVVEIF